MAMKKVCFVICPIGDEGSPEREQADDLYELVLEPALEKYGFQLIRSDKIPRATTITSDIVDLIQNSTLCAIDLTGHNANVFYECGRRHETAKPFIQLLRKGESLPFDLAGIRTIFYDTSSGRSIRDAINEIREFVDIYEAEGYAVASSGGALAALVSAVERLERKVDRVTSSGLPVPASIQGTGGLEALLKHPREQFVDAVMAGRIDEAAGVFPRLAHILGPTGEVVAAAGILAGVGDQTGAEYLYTRLEEDSDSLDEEDLKSAVISLVAYHAATGSESEGLKRLRPVIDGILRKGGLDKKSEAEYTNLHQKLEYGAENYEQALRLARRTLELVPDNPSFSYNASLSAAKLNLWDEAVGYVDQYMALQLATENWDDDYLSQAVRVYGRSGRIEEARGAFSRLNEHFPLKAQALLLDDSLREIVGLTK